VVGLGMDLTTNDVPVAHPTDPNAPDLPPQPILLVRPAGGRCMMAQAAVQRGGNAAALHASSGQGARQLAVANGNAGFC